MIQTKPHKNSNLSIMPRDSVSVSASTSSRSLFTPNPSEEDPSSSSASSAALRLGVDLVAASRRNVSFLRNVSDSDWLFHSPTLLHSIRRYDEYWMPLISDLTVDSTPPVLVPPFDIEWVWFCHSLHPVEYRAYCVARFSKLIGKPAIFDGENEDYAFNRCRQIWSSRYPDEAFENECDMDSEDPDATDLHRDLLARVLKKKGLVFMLLEAYTSETLYLMAARRRYKKLLSLLGSVSDGCSFLVPTVDILLIWITHMSYPTVYAADTNHMEEAIVKMVGPWELVRKEVVEESEKLWQSTFDQPYEKAGAKIPVDFGDGNQVIGTTPVYWVSSDSEDANAKYKSMHPRFLLEVCVYVRLVLDMDFPQTEKIHEFLRLKMLKCHRELKLDKPMSLFSQKSWQKAWHLYCEFRTKGITLEHRQSGSHCFKGTGVLESAPFQWNDLVRAPSLALSGVLDQRVKIYSSITSPVQAPYLLKCVPDRVTDDSGAMISDLILKMNQYRPQEGRWLSRTVLDHAGRECFVIRIRIGGGFWRRGGESPEIVKWEDRIIEVRDGCWSYVADSVGKAPEKIVGRAIPREESFQERRATWSFSSGDELTIEWDPSATISGMNFTINSQSSPNSYVKLLKGKRMQYETSKEVEEQSVEEEHFMTLVRYTDENPTGNATALLNWKLQVVELLPEEDAVFVLLLCLTIVRGVSEIKKEDIGGLLVRRRLKETKHGTMDWGSVMLHPCTSSTLPLSASGSPHLQPWYWGSNANAMFSREGAERAVRQPVLPFSLVEGGDKLYKRGIIS